MRTLPLLIALSFVSVSLGACGADSTNGTAAKGNTTSKDGAAGQATSPKQGQAGQEPSINPAEIAVGATAPAFELPGSDGKNHKLDDYAGQHVVLAFFPKAFTGG